MGGGMVGWKYFDRRRLIYGPRFVDVEMVVVVDDVVGI